MSSKQVWLMFPGLDTYSFFTPESWLNFTPFVKILEQFCDETGENLIDQILKVSETEPPKMACVFATVTAMQISVVRFLSDHGIKANGCVGYSIGEFACGYVDGCFDETTALLLSYTIGKKIDESGCRRGLMTVVEMTENDFLQMYPNSGVHVAAHNSDGCITISASEATVREVVERLKSDRIKCRTVPTFNTPLHCPQMSFLWDTAMETLYRVIDAPRKRSPNWISTTVSSEKEGLRLSCPRYFLLNLCSPVLFKQACQGIPSDSLIIEVAVRPLLEPWIRDNMENIAYILIPDHEDGENNFLIDWQSKNPESTYSYTNKLIDYVAEKRKVMSSKSSAGVYEIR